MTARTQPKRVAMRRILRVWRRSDPNRRADLFGSWPELYRALEQLHQEDLKLANTR